MPDSLLFNGGWQSVVGYLWRSLLEKEIVNWINNCEEREVVVKQLDDDWKVLSVGEEWIVL